MISLTADEKMAALLAQTGGLAEIRDPDGKVIGFFAPIAYENAQHYANAAAHINPVEVQKAKEEKGPGRTTAEVLDYLKCLEKN